MHESESTCSMGGGCRRLMSGKMTAILTSGALLGLLCGMIWPSVVIAKNRPNFLILLADDLGFSDLGCYGGEIQTPNLDRLAARGLRFTQFYNTARCWPTRAALLTGYYPQQVRMDPPQGRLPRWARTLPHYLKPLGYRCYHSGKWHLNGAPRPVADGGFDRSYCLDDHDRHFGPQRHRLDDQPLPPVASTDHYYTTTAIADHAIRCLREHAAEHPNEPFFSYVAFTVPHFPLQAPPEDVAKYRDKYREGWEVVRQRRFERQLQMGLLHCPLSSPEPSLKAPSGKPDVLDPLGSGETLQALPWSRLTPEQQEFQAAKFAVHAAMVDRMDREIGRLLDQLQAMGALDNTVIFFLSDNGASAEILVRGDGHDRAAAPGSAATFLCLGPGGSTVANTPLRRHKIWVHEGGIATPLIVHWPAGLRARGQLRHAIGHVIDFVPTLLDLAGAAPGRTWNGLTPPPLPGRSLVPAFEKDRPLRREFLFFHHSGHRALRMGDWKLVSAHDNQDVWELYHLANDRSETIDLAAAFPERVRRMSAVWQQQEARFRRQANSPPP